MTPENYFFLLHLVFDNERHIILGIMKSQIFF